MFVSILLPVAIATIVAHRCDKLTYYYVKENSLGTNSNQILPIMEQGGNNQAIQRQELTEHQKELLKIPLNAVRVSLFHFAIIGIFLLIRLFVFMGQLSILFRAVAVSSVFCFLQASRVVIILTCLHKANVLNQAELSQSQRRAQRQKWERTVRTHSFQAERHRNQEQTRTMSGSCSSSVSKTSAPKSFQTQDNFRGNRQILDPTLFLGANY